MEIILNVDIPIVEGTSKEDIQKGKEKVVKDFEILSELYITGRLDDVIENNDL